MKTKAKEKQAAYVYQHIRRLLALLKGRFRLGQAIIALEILLGALVIYSRYLFGQILDIALGGKTHRLIIFAVTFSAVTLAIVGMTYYSRYLIGKYRILCGRIVRRKACEKVNSLSVAYYENHHTGSTVSTMISDIERLDKFFLTFVESICSYLPTRIIGGLAVSLFLNYKLTLICLVAVPMFGYLTGKITSKLGKTTNDIQEETENYNSLLRDFINGIHIYKSYNMKQSVDKKFDTVCTDIARKSYAISRIRNIAYGLNEAAHFIPTLILYAVGGFFVFNNELTIGELFIFVNVFMITIDSFDRLSTAWVNVVETAGVSEHFFKLMDADEERRDGDDFSQNDFCLEFKNVSFRYLEDVELLNNISFTVQKGEKVALAGSSGSGKSTIHKLITGHYDTYGGQILMNGHELSQWNLDKLRANFACVNQEAGLFSGSIKDNVAFGNLAASEEAIRKALERAYALDFVDEMPDGIDTQIGEGGAMLSGGQKQRVVIARAILRNAPVLLLDEPTSALDTKSEFFVQQAIDNMEQHKTIFVIAHRLSTVIDADKIIVLDQGQVIDIGTHEELINRCAKYTELYHKQVIQMQGECV